MQFTVALVSLATLAIAAPLPQFDIGALLGGGGAGGAGGLGALLGGGGGDLSGLLSLLGPPPTAEQQASLASLAGGLGDFLSGVMGTNDDG